MSRNIKTSFWKKYLPVILGVVSILVVALGPFGFLKYTEMERGTVPSGIAVLLIAPDLLYMSANNVFNLFANIVLSFLLGTSLGYLILVCFKARQLKTPKGILSIFAFLVLLPWVLLTPFEHFKQKQQQTARMLTLIDEHQSSAHRDNLFRNMIIASTCDKKIAWKLISLNDSGLRSTYAQISISCKKPQDMIHKLAQSNHIGIVMIAAKSQKASPETIRMIYSHYPQSEKIFVMNGNTPEGVLIQIASRLLNLYQNKNNVPTKDQKEIILLLIHHPNLPESYRESLRVLINFPSPGR